MGGYLRGVFSRGYFPRGGSLQGVICTFITFYCDFVTRDARFITVTERLITAFKVVNTGSVPVFGYLCAKLNAALPGKQHDI